MGNTLYSNVKGLHAHVTSSPAQSFSITKAIPGAFTDPSFIKNNPGTSHKASPLQQQSPAFTSNPAKKHCHPRPKDSLPELIPLLIVPPPEKKKGERRSIPEIPRLPCAAPKWLKTRAGRSRGSSRRRKRDTCAGCPL